MSEQPHLPASPLAAGEHGLMVPAQDNHVVDLRWVLSVLRRRKVMIVAVAILLSTFGLVFINQITPLYRASATVVIEGSRQNVINIQEVTQGIVPDFFTGETEAAIIASRDLARRAVARLDLVNNPLFNPTLRPPEVGLVDGLVGGIRAWLRGLLVAPFGEDTTPEKAAALALEESDEDILERVTGAYMGGLSVVPVPRSRLISVSYTSTDPRMAALAANTTAQLYILDQLQTKGQATTRARDWLNTRVNEMRTRVIEAERRLEEFRRQSNLLEVGGTRSVYQEQLGDLLDELSLARSRMAETEARFTQLNALVSAGGGADSAAAVIDSPLISSLRQQEAELRRRVAELRTELRDGHPRLVLARNELADLEQTISQEVAKIAANFRSEVEIARAQVANLQAEISRIESGLDLENEAEVTLRALESEVRANNQLYETLLARFKETDVQDGTLAGADARVISEATVPGGPFFPNARLMTLAAIATSLMVGVGLAFVAEFLDSGFRSLSQFEEMTGLPTLGLVPALPPVKRTGEQPHEAAYRRPNSSFGEAVRTLRTTLLLSQSDRPPRTVLVTSSLPAEGKTSTALSLACTAARSGQRVVILDCDLRHSNLHVSLGTENDLGLSDYLSGQ
ncbi:MAG: exopolysaccharide transport family protein, partial [Alphaproteobacteria bacterium]